MCPFVYYEKGSPKDLCCTCCASQCLSLLPGDVKRRDTGNEIDPESKIKLTLMPRFSAFSRESSLYQLLRTKCFNSYQIGMVLSSYEIATMILVPVVSFFGGSHKKPVFCGWGLLATAVGFFIFTLPHFISPPYQPGKYMWWTDQRSPLGISAKCRIINCKPPNTSLCETKLLTHAVKLFPAASLVVLSSLLLLLRIRISRYSGFL